MKNMEKFEKGPEKIDIQEARDEITLKASEMTEFQRAVKEANSKIAAIKAVRVLLKEKFPEISEILQEKIKKPQQLVPGSPRVDSIAGLFAKTRSNELIIAKDLVDLLWEND